MTRSLEGFLFALLADGTSDRALLPILRWALWQIEPSLQQQAPVFCVRRPADASILDEVGRLVRDYRADLVFVHRDAEGVALRERKDQIPQHGVLVPVVPVRMTEAWLLIDERAIRKASGNPNGCARLDLPPVGRLERIPDPKRLLRDLLIAASGLKGRRRQRFDQASAVQRVADFIQDFSPLREVDAYREFESDLRTAFALQRKTL